MKSTHKVLTSLILFMLIVSADKSADKILISEVSFFEGVYNYNDRPITGEIIDYYENDILKFTYSALDGRLHGKAFEYYTDGSVKSVRNYILNKLFGEFTEYFENGDIKLKFEVGLNAYGQGEELTNIQIAKGKRNKLKKYDEGILLFISNKNGSLQRSSELSILEQNNFKILNQKNQVLFKR